MCALLHSPSSTSSTIITSSHIHIFSGVPTNTTLGRIHNGAEGMAYSLYAPMTDAEFDAQTLNAKNAAALDKDLMSVGAYSLDQLMELAGLSVSQAGEWHPHD